MLPLPHFPRFSLPVTFLFPLLLGTQTRNVYWNYPRRPSLAHAPALLQEPGHRRDPSALGSSPCQQGLLRHGETARRIPAGSPELQPRSFADHTDSGIHLRRLLRPLLRRRLQTRRPALARREAL